MNKIPLKQNSKLRLPKSWSALNWCLNAELEYFVNDCYNSTNTTTPKYDYLFRAFTLTTLDKVKVVILGQDPYPNPSFACGLSFSVLPTVDKLPMSLRNIYKESVTINLTGDLSRWAEQGVLLLNSALIYSGVELQKESMSHWQSFTEEVISLVSNTNHNVVFLLWGNYAHSKHSLIDTTKHLILTTSHPSPFSARLGFLGSGCFVKANEYLIEHKYNPIQW